MFHLDLHITDARPERFPEDGPFVYDPENCDETCLVGTAASELLQGGHATFTLAAAGCVLADELEGYNDVFALVDLVWASRRLVALFASNADGDAEYHVIEQGIDIKFDFRKVGADVIVTVIDLYGDLIADRALRCSKPTETHPAAQLLAEVRQVCQAVIDGGTVVGSDGLSEEVVLDWCRDIGIRAPGGA